MNQIFMMEYATKVFWHWSPKICHYHCCFLIVRFGTSAVYLILDLFSKTFILWFIQTLQLDYYHIPFAGLFACQPKTRVTDTPQGSGPRQHIVASGHRVPVSHGPGCAETCVPHAPGLYWSRQLQVPRTDQSARFRGRLVLCGCLSCCFCCC